MDANRLKAMRAMAWNLKLEGQQSRSDCVTELCDEIEQLQSGRRIAAAIRDAWHQQQTEASNRGKEFQDGVLAGLDTAVEIALRPNVRANLDPTA